MGHPEIDPENLTATVQPGVVIQTLNNAVGAHGLIYPPEHQALLPDDMI